MIKHGLVTLICIHVTKETNPWYFYKIGSDWFQYIKVTLFINKRQMSTTFTEITVALAKHFNLSSNTNVRKTC